MYKASLLIAVVLVLCVGIGQSAGNRRARFTGAVALELDGAPTGILSSAAGGECTGAVVEEEGKPGDPLRKKHIGGVKWEDFSISCGTGQRKALYDWVKSSFDGKTDRKSGSIIYLDRENNEVLRGAFSNALITEIGLPALDAASKDAAKMTLKLSPEVVRTTAGSGQFKIDARKQKQWLPANFRLKIDGLEAACARVNKIEALTIKQKVAVDDTGTLRIDRTLPELVLSVPEADSKQLYDWHDDFVIKGNNGDDREKAGTLEYLDNDLVTPLFTVSFRGLGIFKLGLDKLEGGKEGLRRVKAEMYCEDVRFEYHPAAVEP